MLAWSNVHCLIGYKKKGKLIISHRYNQTPLLYSYPGGFNGSWSYKTYPIAKVQLFSNPAKSFSLFLECHCLGGLLSAIFSVRLSFTFLYSQITSRHPQFIIQEK